MCTNKWFANLHHMTYVQRMVLFSGSICCSLVYYSCFHPSRASIVSKWLNLLLYLFIIQIESDCHADELKQ